MKKIISTVLLCVFVLGWTMMGIASGGAHVGKCKHEWKAGFQNRHTNEEILAEEKDDTEKPAIAVESLLPGALHSLIP